MASEHCQAWVCGSSLAARAGIGSTMPIRTTLNGLLSAHLENMYKLLFQQQPGHGAGQERAATPHSRPVGLVLGRFLGQPSVLYHHPHSNFYRNTMSLLHFFTMLTERRERDPVDYSFSLFVPCGFYFPFLF